MAAKNQQDAEVDVDEVATELLEVYNTVDPTVGTLTKDVRWTDVDADDIVITWPAVPLAPSPMILTGPSNTPLYVNVVGETPSQPEEVDTETEEVAESTEEVSEEPEESIRAGDVYIANIIVGGYPEYTEEISEEPETTTTPTPEEVVKGRVTEEEGDPTPTTTVRF